MDDRKMIGLEQQKKALAEQLWLIYFNESLYRQGLITETQRNRMKNKIECRSCPLTHYERQR